MQSYDAIFRRQLEWARNRGLEPDAKGYLSELGDNLFSPMSEKTKAAFRAGAGDEMEDRPNAPAKMKAMHSSSALVCNVFEYWHLQPEAVARALQIAEPVISLEFEAKLPTGLRGTPPTLDLLLISTDDLAWGVESKFTEPFQGKDRKAFASSYFEADEGLWKILGLPGCEGLARRLDSGPAIFSYLDAPQLLKHALGIRRKYPQGRLLFLWHDLDTQEGLALRKEVGVFSEAIDPCLGFRALTHRQVFESLAREVGNHDDYVAYNGSRYFEVEDRLGA